MDKQTAPVSRIAFALAKAQLEMGPALKDAVNPAFKSKYADLASVMSACMPALNGNGIAVLQPIGRDAEGARYVETMFIHGESGECLSCRVDLIVAKNDMQGYGSAVTYARRYGLMSMAGIAPEDDDGNAAAKSPPTDEPQSSAQALSQAWRDGVLDQLSPNATADDKARAFAHAIAADFTSKGGLKSLHNAWMRHEGMVKAMDGKYPDLHEMVIDAFENRKNELTETRE